MAWQNNAAGDGCPAVGRWWHGPGEGLSGFLPINLAHSERTFRSTICVVWRRRALRGRNKLILCRRWTPKQNSFVWRNRTFAHSFVGIRLPPAGVAFSWQSVYLFKLVRTKKEEKEKTQLAEQKSPPHLKAKSSTNLCEFSANVFIESMRENFPKIVA